MRAPIQDQRSLATWAASPSYASIVRFIDKLADSVKGKKIAVTNNQILNTTLRLILDALRKLATMIDQFPPHQAAMRYGNKAFREWHDKMVQDAPELMHAILEGRNQEESIVHELVEYYVNSFGNPTRIDYGTGHELNFCVWLYCLEKVGALDPDEHALLVLKIFNEYILLMRRLQTTYWLEPAGSHGVWGLDDYQFLPFLLGASQLVDHDHLAPKSIHDEQIVAAEKGDYLYLAAVHFILQVKKGPFFEHSPYLDDISKLGNWKKVLVGLMRMYEGEVLRKLPVVQHLVFGSLFPWCSKFDD